MTARRFMAGYSNAGHVSTEPARLALAEHQQLTAPCEKCGYCRHTPCTWAGCGPCFYAPDAPESDMEQARRLRG